MWKTLIYNKIKYSNFLINPNGQVKNIKTNHIYKISYSKSGYAIITLPLGKRGDVKSIRVHKALAETFIPNPQNLSIVHHKDNDKSNFQLTNLEWVTSKTNKKYELQQNQTPYFNNRKLTKQDITNIKKQKHNKTYNQLAGEYSVSKTTICNVMNNRYYNNGVW